ncbi:MAG: glycine cleavage system protein R [Verrucomicrobia bacterium]|nr:glycine cleavage system protein R [Verrucomicrobiota bacterium]
MRQYLVLSAIGPDRPGIVDTISKLILDHGCNLEDSRMAILGGEFAIVVLMAGDAEQVAQLQKDAAGFGEKNGLTVTTKPTIAPGARELRNVQRYAVRAVGLDHEGIIHQIAHALATLGVNIETLESTTAPAPHTGDPQFILDMRIQRPAQLSDEQLREKLTEACEAVNVDVEILPVG